MGKKLIVMDRISRRFTASLCPRLWCPEKQPVSPPNRAEDEEFEQEGVVPDDGAEDAEQQQVEQDFQEVGRDSVEGIAARLGCKAGRGGGGCQAAAPASAGLFFLEGLVAVLAGGVQRFVGLADLGQVLGFGGDEQAVYAFQEGFLARLELIRLAPDFGLGVGRRDIGVRLEVFPRAVLQGF